jgi:hypothetical protein
MARRGAIASRRRAAAFNPLTLNPTLWLKEDGLPAAGSLISTWTNSGSATNFTQPTTIRQPTCIGNGLNGHKIARFDGSVFMSGPTIGSFISASAYTLFVVVKAASIALSSSNSWQNHGIIADNAQYFGLYLSTNFGASIYNWGGSDDHADVPYAASSWARFQARHASGNLVLSKNGGSESSVASNNTEATAGMSLLGVNDYDSMTGALNGDIAEIFGVNTVLSNSDRANVDAYLTARFGL